MNPFALRSEILGGVKNKSAAYSRADFQNEFISFAAKNVSSCVFPGFIFLALILSKLVEIPYVPRYDFLLIACISMQAFMYFTKLETATEVLVITMFHLIGLVMEIYKVRMGSWYYPEFGDS